VRTDRGGWIDARDQSNRFSNFLRERTTAAGKIVRGYVTQDLCELNHALDLMIAEIKELSKLAPPMPKRIQSKSKLPPPHKFLDYDYVHSNGWAASQVTIRKCKATDIVAVANNLKLISAIQPGITPWFLIRATTMTGGGLKFISNGDSYYVVDNRSLRVRAEWLYEPLSAADREVIKAAIKSFVAKMEEEK
jgi:hypothetical protein